MTNEDISVSTAWARLRSESGETGLEVPSIALQVKTKEGPIRVSVGDGGEPRVLIPIGFRDRMPEVKPTGGLAVRDIKLTAQGRQTRFIDIECVSAGLERVFSEVADEIIRRIAEREAAGRAVEGTLGEFRDLLLKAAGQQISQDRAAALIAELIVLDRLVAIDSTAWKSWTGPAGGRHDFTAGHKALEVKSSVRQHQPIVEISALDQLLEPENGTLTLIHIVLEPNPKGNLSVPDLVGDIAKRVDDAEGFREWLVTTEFDPELPDPWEEHRFTMLSEKLYAVAEGFPRLIPKSFDPAILPTGISHLRYRLDLSAAHTYLIGDDESSQVYVDFCGNR